MVVCIISVEREGSLGTVVGGRFGLYLDHLLLEQNAEVQMQLSANSSA